MKTQTSRQFLARLAARRFSRLLAPSSAGMLSALALLAATPAAMADVTKADNTTALNQAASYTGGVVPTSADRILFNSTISTNLSAALGGDLSILGIVFTNPSGAYTINNTVGATLTLGSSGIDMTGATQNFTINDAVKLGATQTWDVASGKTLTLTGTSGASLDLGSSVLTVQGIGNTAITALLYGSGSITKAGTGTLTLNAATGSANTGNAGNLFSGGITVGSGGTVAISTANASGTGLITSSGTLNISASQLLLSGGITVSAGTTTLSASNAAGTGTVTLNGGTLSLSNSTAAQLASVVLTSGTFTPSASTTFGSLAGSVGFTATAGTLTFGTNNTSGTYSGNIAGAIASNILKSGTGTQILNGTDATTGTITANGSGGTLEIGGQFNGSGAVAVNAGTLRLNFGTNNTIATDLVKSAALTLGGGTLSVAGQNTATNAIQNFTATALTNVTNSNVTVTNGSGTGTTAVNLGVITPGTASTINFNLPSGTQSSTTGSANGILTSSGPTGGGLLLDASNHAYATVNGTDFAAGDPTKTFVQALTGTVNATATTLGGTTDNVNINGTNVAVGATTINTLRFNENAARTLTLSGALTVTDSGILISSAVNTAGSRITGGSITSGTEVIIHQNSPQPFTLDSAVTGGSVLFTKSGTGTLILTKTNTNGGRTYVDSGRLQLGVGGNLGTGAPINLAPNDPTAVFDVNNQTTSVSNLDGGGATGGYVTLGNSGTLNIVGGYGSTFSGSVVGGVDSVINKTSSTGGQGFQTSSNAAFYGTLNVTTGSIGFFTNTQSFINANINIGTSGTVNPGGSAGLVSIGDLSGSGTLAGAGNASTAQEYRIGYLGGIKTFSGTITNGTNATPGITSLTKFGSGTTTLSGTNTFTGTTLLQSGGLTYDFSTGNTPINANEALTVGGGTATFRGLAAGGTTATTGTFGFGNSVLSRVVLDNNGATGGVTVNLKTATINGVATLGSSSTADNILFDTSSSANNVLRTDVAIGAAGTTAADTTAIRTNNGILTTGAGAGNTGYRADVLIRDSTGVGFATTSGTSIVRYTGATALSASDSATVLAEDGTGNYVLNTNLTRSAQFLYNTIQLDSSSQSVTLTDNTGSRFGNGSGSTSGRGVLATGTNGATITSAGGINQATYFNNYQTGATTAGQTLTLNMPMTGGAYFNGTGLTVATGTVNSADYYFQSGVTRLTGVQSSGDALVGGTGVYRLVGGVLEIGAHLTGTTSSTSTADFSRSVGTSAGQVQLLGDTGFSASGGNRTVNLGGAGQQLVWGNDNFLASPASATTDGNNVFRLSSAYSDSMIDFQNAIALGSTTRQVNVADGSATVDARLSGVISGVYGLNVTLANSAPAIANAAAGLTKLGAGTLELTGNNTYSGRTTVAAGTLLINNTPVAGVGSGTGTGAVVVNNGGTLGGIGAIAGATTVGTGGTITGANTGTVGALTLANTLTINGTYAADVLSGTGSDLLKLTGTGASGVLTLGPASILTVTGTVDNSSTYVLATYASESGTFATTTVPSGYSLFYNTNGTELDLVPTAVPEPATCLGGVLLVGAAAWSQRKRFGARQAA